MQVTFSKLALPKTGALVLGVLDKQKLFALNFSATQEIDKIQQEEKSKLEAAETKLAAAETEITTLKDKVTSLETTITDLVARLTALETA